MLKMARTVNRHATRMIVTLMMGLISLHLGVDDGGCKVVFGDDAAEQKLVEANKQLEVANAELAAARKELARLKSNSEKPVALPLDLTDFYSTPTAKLRQSTRYPAWRVVPVGSQTFLNIPLEIGGHLTLWGKKNANNGLVFAEAVKGIPVKRKFDSLYLYHATFHQSPDGTPVYDVVFHFSDGSTKTETILYGDDVRDWYYNLGTEAIPLDSRSRLAWHGVCGDDQSFQLLRFCLTEIENSKPNVEVVSIDFVSSKQDSAGCIMAITTGESGLIP